LCIVCVSKSLAADRSQFGRIWDINTDANESEVMTPAALTA
jgi:hypothetical protein